MRMEWPIEGGCECGDVRYRVLADPVTVYACHCTDCQTATGTAFTLNMVLSRESFELVSGETKSHDYLMPDGRPRSTQRCVRCETKLWGAPRDYPDLVMVQPGSLDDTSWFEPAAHIWTRSRQPWVRIPPGALTYEKQAEDPLPMVRAWKNR